MFRIDRATRDDLDSIDAILHTTAEEVDDRNMFVADDREYVARHIAGNGFVLIARSGDDAAGFLLVDYPGKNGENLGRDLGWDGEKLNQCAHMDIACVLKAYRGFGLQKQLLCAAERTLAQEGYRYALATVAPENAPSLKSLISAGYVVGATKAKYGGVIRHIVWKSIG